MFGKFYKKYRQQLFIALLFFLPALPLLWSRYQLPRFNLYDSIGSYVVHPLASLLYNLTRGVGVLSDRYVFLLHVREENEKLKGENAQLRENLLNFKELQQENQRLSRLLAMPETSDYPRAVGRIIGQESSPERFGFIINIGSRDGVQKKRPVIVHDGIVGTITHVFPNYSMFISLIDPSHFVDATVARSRAQVLLQGGGASLSAKLKYLDRSEDVQVGDELLTSGLDGVFPKGLSVGTIVRVHRPESGVSQEAEVRPASDLGRLEEVMVLLDHSRAHEGSPPAARVEALNSESQL